MTCPLKRSAASRDQRLFALYLPRAELTRHTRVHGVEGSQRQMRVQALDEFGLADVLVLDRGYPAAWLIALLSARSVRCDSNSGWAEYRAFVRGQRRRQWVTLKAPSAQAEATWSCARAPQRAPGAPSQAHRGGAWEGHQPARTAGSPRGPLRRCTTSAGASRRRSGGSTAA